MLEMLKIIWSLFTSLSICQAVVLFVLCCLPVISAAQPLMFGNYSITPSELRWGEDYTWSFTAISLENPTQATTLTLHIEEGGVSKRIDETPYGLADEFLPLAKQVSIPALDRQTSTEIRGEAKAGMGLVGGATFRYCDDSQSLCTAAFQVNYLGEPPNRDINGRYQWSITSSAVMSGSCAAVREREQNVEITQTTNIAAYSFIDDFEHHAMLSAAVSTNTYVFTAQYRTAPAFPGTRTMIVRVEFSDDDNGSGRAYWSYRGDGGDLCQGTYDVQYSRLSEYVKVRARVFLEGPILYNAVQFVGVCDRTHQVRDTIISLTGDSDCGEVSRVVLESITTMTIVSAGISSLSEGDFRGLSNLQELYLGYNEISTLPVGIFSGLSNLQYLDLSLNEISTLPLGIFSGLSNLQWLYLGYNEISTLPVGIFSGLSNLQWLYLGYNEISTLPVGIFSGLSNLQQLFLNNNDISTLPMGVFRGLSNLQNLELSGNEISTLPSDIFSGLSNLWRLRLDDNKLSHNYCNALKERLSISLFWCGGSTLQIISPMRDTSFNLLIGGSEASATTQIEVVISDTAIQTTATITLQLDSDGEPVESTPTSPITLAPADDDNTQRTTEFILTAASAANTTMMIIVTDDMENRDEVAIYVTVQFATVRNVCDRTQQVRDAITSLTGNSDCGEVSRAALESITTMDISEAGINSVSEGDFSGLSNLQDLDLGDNDLSTLPSGIFSGLSKLRFLRLNYSGISTLPSGIFNRLSNLEELYLEGNNLSMLPVGVFSGLRDLQYLDLKENSLSTLPAGIFSGLSALEELYLDGNGLSMLPVGIFNGLSNLQYLHLHDNNLSTLPVGVFSGLSNLQDLLLDSNNLSMLPMGVFSELSSLEELDLDDNKLGHNYCNALEERLSISYFSCGGSTLQIISPMRDTSFNLLVGGSEASATTKIKVVISDTAIQTTATITLQLDSDGEPVESIPTSPITLAPADNDNRQRITEFILTAVSAANTAMTIIVTDDMENRDEVAIDVTVQFATVRSDIRDAIMQRHPQSTTMQTVLLEGAQALQNALWAGSVSHTATALETSEVFDHALDCVEDEDEAFFILTSAIDTFDRLRDYVRYNELLHGQVFTDSQRPTPCPGEGQAAPRGFRTPSLAPPVRVTEVFFINGIGNDKTKAETHVEKIAEAYASYKPGYRFTLLYNSNMGSDILEFLKQKIREKYPSLNEEKLVRRILKWMSGDDEEMDPEISAEAIAKSQDKLDSAQALKASLKMGNRVVLIAHSQGNLFANGILQSISDKYQESIGMIGIASVVSTNTVLINSVYGKGYPYVTLTNDKVINSLRRKFTVLPANTSNTSSTLTNHSFQKAYFKDGLKSREKIDEHMKAYMKGLKYPEVSMAGVFVEVCDRTWQVREAITALTGNSDCGEVSRADLESIMTTTMTIANVGISSLSEGDFSGLSNLQYLGLGGNEISMLPVGIFSGLSNLQELYLSGNNISTLRSDVFSGLSKLQELYLSGNNISTLPVGIFSGLSNLQRLSLWSNEISTLPVGIFSGLSNLQSLDLGNNDISLLPVGIFSGLSNLRQLELWDNEISTLPMGVFSGLGNLQWLDLGGNEISTLQSGAFSGLSNLQWLDLDRNKISILPVGIFNGLSNLQSLSLYNNEISTLRTGAFSGLSNLQELYLWGNDISLLPTGIFSGLSNLQGLFLSDNEISTLPLGIFSGLSNLQWLSLVGNEISTLPVGIFSGLSNLQWLDLDRNGISTLPVGIFSGLSNLYQLDLNSNEISTLPVGIFSGLSNLYQLDLNSNDLSTLPLGIFSGLSNLQELYLNNNEISTLPVGIFSGLSNLQQLGLGANEISTLPVGIFSGLSNLYQLDLNSNDLSTLPVGIFSRLSNLQWLGLGGNNLSTLPVGIFSGLSNLQWLDLDRNGISTLPVGIFSGLSNLQWLWLQRNNLGSEYCTSLRNQLSIRIFICD